MGEIRTLVVAVVDPEEDLRRAICLLLELELGARTRSAATMPSLLATLASNEELALLVGRASQLRGAADQASFGLLDLPSTPFDAEGLLREVRRRLSGRIGNL